MARLLVCPSTSVWPSGADLATLSTPRLPLAPGRLSTSTLQPLCSAIFCATVRAVMSGPPPARNGTTSRIGFPREAPSARGRAGGGGGGREGAAAGGWGCPDSPAAPAGGRRAGPPAPARARRRRTGAAGAKAAKAGKAAWSLVSVANSTLCAFGAAPHAVRRRHRTSRGAPKASHITQRRRRCKRGATVAKAVGQRAGIHRYQLTLAPESLTILPQRGTSVRSSSAKRSALPPSTSPPSERSFSATSGCASA